MYTDRAKTEFLREHIFFTDTIIHYIRADFKYFRENKSK